jgi:hypothetical protein
LSGLQDRDLVRQGVFDAADKLKQTAESLCAKIIKNRAD